VHARGGTDVTGAHPRGVVVTERRLEPSRPAQRRAAVTNMVLHMKNMFFTNMFV
jgi:hypothetical protein